MQLEAKTQVTNAEIHKKKNTSSFIIWVVKSEKKSNIPLESSLECLWE